MTAAEARDRLLHVARVADFADDEQTRTWADVLLLKAARAYVAAVDAESER